jgi:hypothetical protein
MQIHKVPDELKTLWNMGLVHITTHNLKRGVGDLRNSTIKSVISMPCIGYAVCLHGASSNKPSFGIGVYFFDICRIS